MKKNNLISIATCFCLQISFSLFTHSQTNAYANLIWKDVEDGSILGQRGLQIVDLDNDGKQDILSSGRMGSDIGHFFIYTFINGQYVKRWNSKLYPKGISAVLATKLDSLGGYKICVLSNYNEIEIYDGKTLNIVDSFKSDFGDVREIAIDNVDGQSDKELIMISPYGGLKVLSLTTKQLKWSNPDIKGFDVKVGDLDNDGKKEIITSTSGWEIPKKIYVLDAFTKTIKWTSDENQFYNIYLFDVNEDGFLDIVGSTSSEIIYINTQTKRSVNLVTSTLTTFSGIYYVGDIDNDKKSEVLVGIYGGGVAGYNFNGVQMWSVGTLDYSLIRFAVGDTDEDGKTDVVRTTSSGSSGDMHLYINDFQTKQLRFGNTINKGYSTFGISDIDNDGNLDMVVSNSIYAASTTNLANYPKGQFRNYNLKNRQKTKTSYSIYIDPYDQMPMRGIGQSRDKQKREIATDFGIIDASTHSLLTDINDVLLWATFQPIKFADVDSDGIDEVLSSAYGVFQVYKYSQNTFKYKLDWEIKMLAGIKFIDVAIKNIDTDTAKELITINNFGKVTVYDTKSKNLEWQSEDIKARCIDVADVDLDGKLELLIGTDNGYIIVLDAQTKEEKKRIYGFSFTLHHVKAVNLDTTSRLEIIAVENAVKIFDSKTGDVLWDMPNEFDEVYPNLFSIEAHDVNKDGYMELYFANQHGIFIFGINQPVKNGTTAISEIAPIPISCTPNPSDGFFELDVYSDKTEKGSIELLNTEGVIVYRKDVELLSNGSQKYPLDMRQVNNGLYILWLKTPTGSASKKIIISK
jgi:hypothetical protein